MTTPPTPRSDADEFGSASALRAPVQVVVAGMAVEVREATHGEWIPAEATSGVEGMWRDGRKVHDFPVVWVEVAGADGPLPWPAEDVRIAEPWALVDAVRLAVGDSKPTGQDPSVSVEETPQ